MNYVNEQIFTDNRLNILADRLFYYLNEQFTFDEVALKFLLTGRSSAILQGELAEPATNFIFVTNNSPIYDFLLLKINDFMKAKSIVKFKERIILEFEFCKMEIWYQSGSLAPINYNDTNVYIQYFSKIPEILY